MANILQQYIDSLGSKVNVKTAITDRTSTAGMTPQAIAQLRGAIAAAQAAGLSQITIKAAKGEGHKSHGSGTEWDITGVNQDGTRWTNAQRVAVAKGAQSAGADRFGFYMMDRGLGQGTLHFGYSGKGRPAAVWGAGGKTKGDAARRFTDPSERAFLQAYQGGGTAKQPRVMPKAEARAALAELGFTGASAIMQFQRAADIKADGIVGKDTTREIRNAINQGTRYASGGIPSPGMPLPRERPIAPTPPVSASDRTRDYQRGLPMAAPTLPVERGPQLAAPQRAYDPVSSIAAPSAPRVAQPAPVQAAPQIAATRLGGIGSDPDRNVTSVRDPGNVGMMRAEMQAARINSDLSNLRAGSEPNWGTGASLPAPRTSAVTMGANSEFDDGTAQRVAAQPTFSSRTSRYDPLSSIRSTPAVTPPSAASFDDRWEAALGAPAAREAVSEWVTPYSSADATRAVAPKAPQVAADYRPPAPVYDPLSSIRPPIDISPPNAVAVSDERPMPGPEPLGDLEPLTPAPQVATEQRRKAPAAQKPQDAWAATPKMFRPQYGISMLGGMAGGILAGPAGNLLGKLIGAEIGKRLAPSPTPPLTNQIGTGLQSIEAIRGGAGATGDYAAARNNAPGYSAYWSVGPNGQPMQTVYTPSGNNYQTYTIGPSLSPMEVTTYGTASRPVDSGRSYPSSAPSAGGVY